MVEDPPSSTSWTSSGGDAGWSASGRACGGGLDDGDPGAGIAVAAGDGRLLLGSGQSRRRDRRTGHPPMLHAVVAGSGWLARQVTQWDCAVDMGDIVGFPLMVVVAGEAVQASGVVRLESVQQPGRHASGHSKYGSAPGKH